MFNPIKWFAKGVIQWLVHEEEPPASAPPCDFERLSFEIRPCDVLLVEGRSRVSEVIKTITHSPWTHSALYIGRMVDIEDPVLREHINWLYDGDPDEIVNVTLIGAGLRQARALDEEFHAGERFGLVAVAYTFECRDEALLLGSQPLDLDGRTVIGEQRTVTGNGLRLGGEALQLHLALDAMRARNAPDEDKVFSHIRNPKPSPQRKPGSPESFQHRKRFRGCQLSLA